MAFTSISHVYFDNCDSKGSFIPDNIVIIFNFFLFDQVNNLIK